MSELDFSKGLTVRTFGFNIPCRRFVLAAKVTRDRRMPMVDEFVLRALKLTEQLTLIRLAGFFGFSLEEMQTVVADLASRSLVVVDGENVRLHASANEMLRTSSDGIPTILEVESWVESLWFDLISGSMIPYGIRRGTNLVDITPPASLESVSVEFARTAFEENFREYLKIYRKMHNPDAFSLYAVTDVQPSQYGHVAIAGTEELTLYPQPKLQPSLLESEGDRPLRVRQLNEAMRSAYDGLTDPDPSLTARAEYDRLAGSNSLQAATSSSGFVDLERWQRAEIEERPPGTATLVGAVYLERNRQIFRTLITQRAIEAAPEGDQLLPELLWLRPTGSSWGASDDLRALLAEVRGAVRDIPDRRRSVRTTLVVPAADRGSHPSRFKRLFDHGILAPPGYLPPALEVLVVRGIAAAVLVWVALSESCGVWVGRATTRSQDLSALEERLQYSDLHSRSKRLWSDVRLQADRKSD
jgi:hypothetical protein